MNLDHLCMGCMGQKGAGPVCPQCGWKEGGHQDSALHLPPRTLLQEKYLIGRVLGQGGFGITYLAWDIFLDRKLAVKEYFPREFVYRAAGDSTVLLHSGVFDEQYIYGLDKFLDEAKTLARFEGHPNIIAVKDFFRANGTAYLVMNYLQGATLKDYLQRRGAGLPFDEALAVMLPVMDALQAVHAEGMLHRDISPDNIFITAQGLIILLDFGAARHALGERGRNLSIILKPGYAPEEQYRSGGSQGPWTDIYAVAATFYHIITGRMPPDSLDRLENDPLLPPSHLGAAIGRAQEAALLKAIAVRASNRYQTIAAFQEAIWKGAGGTAASTTGSVPGKAPAASVSPAAGSLAAAPRPEPRSVPGLQASRVINIGRHPDNDLVLGDETVSRYHAGIYQDSGRWVIEDRGSTHGTFVNGARISGPVELTPADRIGISGLNFYFDGVNLLDEQGEIVRSLPGAAEFTGAVSGAATGQNGLPGGGALRGRTAKIPGALPYVVGAAILVTLIAVGIFIAVGLKKDGGTSVAGPDRDNTVTYGTIEYDGGVYTGDLKSGLPHGHGTLIYKSGSGSLGYSVLVTSGERKYVGQWVNGRKHGEGTMTLPDGSTLAGIWENDSYVGPSRN